METEKGTSKLPQLYTFGNPSGITSLVAIGNYGRATEPECEHKNKCDNGMACSPSSKPEDGTNRR
jgi:hypothetical protein